MRNGRGLSGNAKILWLPTRQIRPNPSQPRKIFDPEGLRELADSIRRYGILQPLTVRRVKDCYELVAGERRLRAARLAGCAEVPCLLLAVDDERSGIVALVENLQRQDLDYIEEAEGLLRLMRLYRLSQEEAAARVGKSQSAVANKLRLLRLSPTVLARLREHHLSERHARALLRLPDEEARLTVLTAVVKQQLNVAKTEAYIEQWLEQQRKPQGSKRPAQKDLQSVLKTLTHTLEQVRGSGIEASTSREETETEIVLTIRLPKQRAVSCGS